MPVAPAGFVEFVFSNAVMVSRFVRPFVAHAAATRAYVQRVFVRAYGLRLHRVADPTDQLARLALHEVRRAVGPRGPAFELLAHVDDVDRAAYLLVRVQELPLLRVAAALQVTLGTLLRHAEDASRDITTRYELRRLATGAIPPSLPEQLAELRSELPLPQWNGLELARLAAELEEQIDLASAVVSLVPAPRLVPRALPAASRAPFLLAASEPRPMAPPPSRSIREREAHESRRARQQRLRLVCAGARGQPPELDVFALPPVSHVVAARPAVMSVAPPVRRSVPPRRVDLRSRRAALPMTAVVCMGLGALVAHAAPAWFRPRTALAVLEPSPAATSMHVQNAPVPFLPPPPPPPAPPELPTETLPVESAPFAMASGSAPVPIARAVPFAARTPVPVAQISPPALASVAVPSPASAVSPGPLSLQEAIERAAGGSHLERSVALATAPSGASRQPSVGATSVALGPAKAAARACLGTDDAPSRAVVTFGSDGAVRHVDVSGPASFTPARMCIERAFSSAHVAPFLDESFSAALTVRP